MGPDRLADLEAVAYLAWPPAVTEERDGWITRYGGGFSRRLNSVTVGPDAATDHVEERLGAAGEWLSAHGTSLVVRLTTASPLSIDVALGDLGLVVEGRTVVMIADLGASPTTTQVLPPVPSTEWLGAQQTWMGISDSHGWRTVLGRIKPPAVFVERVVDERVAAVGIGVVRDGWLGIFEVTTDPALRRMGHARELVDLLLGWGVAAGASSGFLQVVVTNRPALELYRGFGFIEAYRYWYRR